MKFILYVSFCFLFLCFFSAVNAQSVSLLNLDQAGMTVSTRVMPPDSFVRPPFPETSVQSYFQDLAILPQNTKVMKYDGYKKSYECYSAVLKTDTDMEQNMMHGEHMIQYLRGQYLFEKGKFDLIDFSYDDNRTMSFEQYGAGARFVWQDSLFVIDTIDGEDYSAEAFAIYMKEVFTNSSSKALTSDTKVISQENLSIGDVFVQPSKNRTPGHAVLVIDMVVNPYTGERLILLGQGYSPTQDMHIIHNPYESDISPWYRVQEDEMYFATAQWIFRKKHIRRFRINANQESSNLAGGE